jgi:hypothetical protein
MPRIFDNIATDLLPALRDTLQISQRSDFCVGYFNLRGWKAIDALIEQWPASPKSSARWASNKAARQDACTSSTSMNPASRATPLIHRGNEAFRDSMDWMIALQKERSGQGSNLVR